MPPTPIVWSTNYGQRKRKKARRGHTMKIERACWRHFNVLLDLPHHRFLFKCPTSCRIVCNCIAFLAFHKYKKKNNIRTARHERNGFGWRQWRRRSWKKGQEEEKKKGRRKGDHCALFILKQRATEVSSLTAPDYVQNRITSFQERKKKVWKEEIISLSSPTIVKTWPYLHTESIHRLFLYLLLTSSVQSSPPLLLRALICFFIFKTCVSYRHQLLTWVHMLLHYIETSSINSLFLVFFLRF